MRADGPPISGHTDEVSVTEGSHRDGQGRRKTPDNIWVPGCKRLRDPATYLLSARCVVLPGFCLCPKLVRTAFLVLITPRIHAHVSLETRIERGPLGI